MKQNKSFFVSFAVIFLQFFILQNTFAAGPRDFVNLVEKAKPSVVSISTTIKPKKQRFFSRRSSKDSTRGPSGSGFIISSDGYVLTNNHVIEAVDRVFVRLNTGEDLEAEIVGTDAETDIALLKIERKKLIPFKIGNLEKTKVGSWVVAIGAPFGFEQTVTAGIISAKGRSVGEQYIPYIQTDVAINPGNSGGPLINMAGKVVGINSKILSTSGGSNGLSFSIPIDLAMDVVDQIKNDGGVHRGYLGVSYQEVSFEMAQSFGLKHSKGALLNSVSPDSPASKAGLRAGDIILKIDNKEVINSIELPFIIGRYRPGDSAQMDIIREGKSKQINITVGSRDGDVAVLQTPSTILSDKSEWLGAEFKDIPQDVANQINISRGIMLSRIDSGAFYSAGIREGDIIQSIQLKAIENLSEFKQIINRLPTSGKVPVLVIRPGSGSQYVILDLDE